MADEVLFERRGAGLWATLNRPDALNAISPGVIAGLDRALDAAERDPEVRAVVITGTGRAFCAGADLKYLRSSTDADATGIGGFIDDFLALLNRIEGFRRPVIAAVNGLALAGGLEIVLTCDLVVAAASAKFGDAHANFGLLPGGGGSVRLPRKIGPTRAKQMLYTAEFLPAATLAQWGLVNEVAPDGGLAAAADALVAKMADKSPLVLARMKALVDDGLEQPRDVALRNEAAMIALHAHSHDMREGLAAFEAKRKPVFTGR
ncbi:MAG: enoyl-CoA hydratase/isomerase family protein [Rhodospirillales bacterium]|nr:MAG: enoyl-CoA hydratase/isomerase family protein [Rhodospirillales bacterium]